MGTKKKSVRLRESLKEQLDELVSLTDEARISEEMARWLRFIGQFHGYSLGNIRLILMQRPSATRVAGYRKWQDLGFQVARGERGIGILAPMPYERQVKDGDGNPVVDPATGEPKLERGVWFKTVHVFDVEQVGVPCPMCGVLHPKEIAHRETYICECGLPLDLPDFPRQPQWATEGEDGEGLAARLEAYARTLGIEVVEAELPGKARGRSDGGQVVLSPGLSPLGRASSLAHEVAHEAMHPVHARTGVGRRAAEVEAEAVAWVVLDHFGLAHPGAPNYLALWDKEGGVLEARMERVADAAQRIIEALLELEAPIPLEIPEARVPA